MAITRPRSRETENEGVIVGGDVDEGGEGFEEDRVIQYICTKSRQTRKNV